MTLTKQEIYNLTLFLNRAKNAIAIMARDTQYPELKSIYSRIYDNLKIVPIKLIEGHTINSENGFVTMGENLKQYDNGALKSQIRIPHDHLFDSEGRIKIDGALTLLHEECHVILPRSAQNFTANIGLHYGHTDEFFADVLSSHVAKKIGFHPRDITDHLVRRRTYFRFPIDKFVFSGLKGVEKEIREGRFTPIPREQRRAPRRPLFKSREGLPKTGIFPGLKREAPGWMPGLRKRPRMIRPL